MVSPELLSPELPSRGNPPGPAARISGGSGPARHSSNRRAIPAPFPGKSRQSPRHTVSFAVESELTRCRAISSVG